MMKFTVQMPSFWEIFGVASDAAEPGQVDLQGLGQNQDPPAMSSASRFTQDGAGHTPAQQPLCGRVGLASTSRC